MARWHPPQTLEIPWRTMVLQADPQLPADAVRQPQFEFSGGRVFFCNPNTSGPYDGTRTDPVLE